VVLFWGSSIFKRFLINRAFKKYNIGQSTSQSIATFSRYLIIVLGMVIILQSSGINLSSLSILFGALGVGIGFGLQNITNNFISGIIILFEKPIKVGDRVEVGDVQGQIVDISARATTVVTNDNISIIVPNSEFVSSQVINWSHNEESVRFKIPVSVSYSSDVRLVERLLLEVAKEDPDVLAKPSPAVRFMEFGDSGLLFELRAWSSSLMYKPGKLVSSLNFRIIEKFREHNIEIPFPQRDLNLRGGFEKFGGGNKE
jgi:small-conductance mechanosensitive channel